jgi:hypothetical protein
MISMAAVIWSATTESPPTITTATPHWWSSSTTAMKITAAVVISSATPSFFPAFTATAIAATGWLVSFIGYSPCIAKRRPSAEFDPTTIIGTDTADNDLIAHTAYIRGILHPSIVQFGNVNKALFPWKTFHENAEILHATDNSTVGLPHFDVAAEHANFPQCGIQCFLGCGKYCHTAAIVIVHIDLRAG